MRSCWDLGRRTKQKTTSPYILNISDFRVLSSVAAFVFAALCVTKSTLSRSTTAVNSDKSAFRHVTRTCFTKNQPFPDVSGLPPHLACTAFNIYRK